MAEIQIGFGAIVEHVNLAMLVGRHGSRVDVEVRIEFLGDDLEAPMLEKSPQRGAGEPFAERRDHAAGDKDVFHVTG